MVSINYEDLVNGGHGTIYADLAIAADGASSSIRQLMLPHLNRRTLALWLSKGPS